MTIPTLPLSRCSLLVLSLVLGACGGTTTAAATSATVTAGHVLSADGTITYTVADGTVISYVVPTGARATAGHWQAKVAVDATTGADVLAQQSAREPDFKITFPVGAACFGWHHYLPGYDPAKPDASLDHPNSASAIKLDGGTLTYQQYATFDCTVSKRAAVAKTVTASVAFEGTPDLLVQIVPQDTK